MTTTAGIGVRFDEFTVERRLAARPGQVFRAFADEAAKGEWFRNPSGGTEVERAFDFRVGGVEVYEGRTPDGLSHRFVATYHDIVPGRRIVYSYEMYVDGVKLSVSQTTIQLFPDGDGARLSFTEYGAYLDEQQEPAVRRDGTEQLLDALAACVDSPHPEERSTT